MTTNYLLCVLIVMLAYVIGEIAGKQPPMDERPSRSVVMVLGLLASLILGLILWSVVGVTANFLSVGWHMLVNE